MTDPIADILRKLDIDMAQAVASGSIEGLGNYDEPAKQIRQQIGRELLETFNEREKYLKDVMQRSGLDAARADIREVCQLEDEE